MVELPNGEDQSHINMSCEEEEGKKTNDFIQDHLTSSMVLKSLPVSSLRLFFSSLGLEEMTVLRS
jgi:hypothetical protein